MTSIPLQSFPVMRSAAEVQENKIYTICRFAAHSVQLLFIFVLKNVLDSVKKYLEQTKYFAFAAFNLISHKDTY